MANEIEIETNTVAGVDQPADGKQPEVCGQTQAIDEVLDEVACVKLIGQCKWFNASLGYGFLTVCNGPDTGKDIFVHHSGIKPSNSHYRTLWKGEYVSFALVHGPNGMQATDVTGVCGGSLMCDVVPVRRPQGVSAGAIGGVHHHSHHHAGHTHNN